MKIRLNENEKVVKMVKEGLKKKNGYCPCRLEMNEDTKCMCKEFREQIADENFEEMKVTCSPQMTPGNRILLESLLKDLNPKARILDSKLLGNL